MTHGDRIASRGCKLRRIFIGHFHTSSSLGGIGISNGSLIGPNQYGRDGRMDTEPRQQTMTIFLATKGEIAVMKIRVGRREERSICG